MAANAALTATESVPETVISTNVPSSGRQRRISVFEREFIETEQTFDAVSDMAAGEGCAADIFDVILEFELRAVLLAGELPAPFLIADFVAVGFAIVQDFELPHAAIGVQGEHPLDVLVLAQHFVPD